MNDMREWILITALIAWGVSTLYIFGLGLWLIVEYIIEKIQN